MVPSELACCLNDCLSWVSFIEACCFERSKIRRRSLIRKFEVCSQHYETLDERFKTYHFVFFGWSFSSSKVVKKTNFKQAL